VDFLSILECQDTRKKYSPPTEDFPVAVLLSTLILVLQAYKPEHSP